jgi:hypothetical protein
MKILNRRYSAVKRGVAEDAHSLMNSDHPEFW